MYSILTSKLTYKDINNREASDCPISSQIGIG
jgi:hypothetical protein